MSNLPAPRYSIWQAISAALALGQRAIEEVRALSREPGPEGKKGDPGPVGMGFDDLQMVHDGERIFTLKFVRGEQIKEFSFTIPSVLDRGVWKDGQFAKGDGVTWNGSFFIAQRDTSTKPETSNSDWRLAIKRGRDGGGAYDLARRRGFKGSEQEWLASLKGESGAPGRPGKDAYP